MKIGSINKKFIIDVDTGVDDALAILLMEKYHEQNILGITTVGGNVSVEKVTKNTLGVVNLSGQNTPVYVGSSKNLENNGYLYAKNYHGENGLSNIDLDTPKNAEKMSATDFIISSAKKYPKKLIYIGLGPQTNLAKALIKSPEIANLIDKVIIMGGAVDVPGNETEFAEFNFYQDTEAVKIVLEKIKNIYIIPLDVTGKCFIYKDDIKKFNTGPIGDFVAQLVKNWYSIFGKAKNRSFELYDPLAVSTVLGDFLKFKKIKIGIIHKGEKRGKIFNNGTITIKYANEVNATKFSEFFTQSINNYYD